jgi:hypothetical protein
MESFTPYILYFSGLGIVGSFIIGIIIGWFANNITNSFLYKPGTHPEMFDSFGNLIPDEVLAVRFENSIDDLDEDEYNDEE